MGPETFNRRRLDDEDDDECEGNPNQERESRAARQLLEKQRTIFISEPISAKLTQRVTTQLLWLDSRSEEPIRVYINTPGGSADDGFAIHDMLRFIKSPVYNICFGLNASAGILVLLGTSADRRLALPNARLMMHQPSGGGRGQATDIEITAQEIIKLRQRANEVIGEQTGKSAEEVAAITDRDCWLSAEEAKDFGLVSRIVGSLGDIF